jgi:hypothetical protein
VIGLGLAQTRRLDGARRLRAEVLVPALPMWGAATAARVNPDQRVKAASQITPQWMFDPLDVRVPRVLR